MIIVAATISLVPYDDHATPALWGTVTTRLFERNPGMNPASVKLFYTSHEGHRCIVAEGQS